MTFANPNVLWFLLAIPPAMFLFFWWSWRTRTRLMTQFIQARLLPGLVAGASAARQRWSAVCLVAAVCLLLLAIARPQWGYTLQEVKQRGLDIVVAIDTSRSMLAEDVAPNRLARAKFAALDLMQQAKSDRLGLVAFSGTAFLECPLTVDDVVFRQSVEALDVNTLPEGGTAIAEAIKTALKAYKEDNNFKVLVIFTDGEDHDSGALDAAKRAADAHMRIFTIGIGSAEGEILRIRDSQGRPDFVRDLQGNVVKSRLNEKLLQEIADTTPGGLYLPLRGANAMDILYQRGLAPLPKSDGRQTWLKEPRERYHWPLGAAILLLMLEIFIPERRREARRANAPVAAGAAATRMAVGLLLLLPLAAWGSAGSALRDYDAGKYKESLTEYERLIGKALDQKKSSLASEEIAEKILTGDDKMAESLLRENMSNSPAGLGPLNYNAGAAAYKAGDYQTAAKRFILTTADPDWKLQERAYYNLGNTSYQLGDRTQDPDQKERLWNRAIQSYTSALNLDPKDVNADQNRAFVKERLKELKKQQQQQQNSGGQGQKQKPKDDDSDQSKQQQDGSKPKPDPSQTSQDSGGKNGPPQQSQQQAGRPDEKDQPRPEQPEQANHSENTNTEGNAGEPMESTAAYPPGEMTPQQARRLLENQKHGEMMLPARPQGRPLMGRPAQDW